MSRLTMLSVLLVAFVHQQTLAARHTLMSGGEFRLSCALDMTGDWAHHILQFFIEKHEVKMYNGRAYDDTLTLVSNGTTIVPAIANYTDRYSIQEGRNGQSMLVIENVTEADSAWYGCRKFDLERNRSRVKSHSEELLVPGPFDGIFWTSNYSDLNLNVAREYGIDDGGRMRTANPWHAPDVACVVLASNIQPKISITIGRFGEPGSVDITKKFEPKLFFTGIDKDVGFTYRVTIFYAKRGKFRMASLRDVHCRASVLNTTYEKSVNIQVISKPKIGGCDPLSFHALVGSQNVTLTCLVDAHPEPRVEWNLPSGMKINTLSNNPNYTLTTEARFEGLFTTLTIAEITEDYNFGRIMINATNTEGSGKYYVYLQEGSPDVGAAGVTRSSAALVTMTTWLLVWMLK